MDDQSRFLELYLAHEEGLRTCIRALLRSRSEYEDVFQVVVLTLWKKFDTYDPSRPFGAWARGVAVREVLEARRQDGRRPTPFSPEAVQAILEAFDRQSARGSSASDRMEALDRCVSALPSRLRGLLGLRYGKELAIKEVADELGRSAAATQRELSRVRQRLADCVRRRLALSGEGADGG